MPRRIDYDTRTGEQALELLQKQRARIRENSRKNRKERQKAGEHPVTIWVDRRELDFFREKNMRHCAVIMMSEDDEAYETYAGHVFTIEHERLVPVDLDAVYAAE